MPKYSYNKEKGAFGTFYFSGRNYKRLCEAIPELPKRKRFERQIPVVPTDLQGLCVLCDAVTKLGFKQRGRK